MTFYVYIHKKLSTGEVFYVGKGKNYRAWDRSGRTDYWKKIVNKHGLVIEIVMSGLQEWYAFELEAELICLYGRRDIRDGSLVNMSDGGEGASGVIKTKETRMKMSNAKRGIIFSDTHKLNLSKAHLGKKLTEVTKAKMTAYRLGKPHSEQWKNNQKIGVQKSSGKKITRQDGVVFNSLLEAARSVCDDVSKHASIATSLGALLKGKRKQQDVYGYTWFSV